jgi:hypothetical protein
MASSTGSRDRPRRADILTGQHISSQDQETAGMAKISSRGGRTLAQVRASRPDEPDTWLTLTVTSDGRLLRKVTTAHRSPWGTHYSRSNNRVIAKVTKPDEVTAERLMQVAARLGYPEPMD